MRVPLVYTASEVARWTVSEEVESGKWKPARPCGFCDLSWDHFRMRCKAAWRVFTGRYDCLNWQKTGEKPNTMTHYKDILDSDFVRATHS